MRACEDPIQEGLLEIESDDDEYYPYDDYEYRHSVSSAIAEDEYLDRVAAHVPARAHLLDYLGRAIGWIMKNEGTAGFWDFTYTVSLGTIPGLPPELGVVAIFREDTTGRNLFCRAWPYNPELHEPRIFYGSIEDIGAKLDDTEIDALIEGYVSDSSRERLQFKSSLTSDYND